MSGVVILTGAGISADSGVATFRDKGGLWEGLRVEEVATPEAWERDPALVWRFYQRRRADLPKVQPNAAHHALVDFERRLSDAGIPFLLVTQNVDDLHERAGSRELLHMHGEIAVLRCEVCDQRRRDLELVDETAFIACTACGHPRVRPDVVWFGELPFRMDEIEAALSGCTHFLALGTSGAVYPAAFYLAAAREVGARTWVNSLEPPENLEAQDEFLPGRAVEVVPGLLEKLLQQIV